MRSNDKMYRFWHSTIPAVHVIMLLTDSAGREESEETLGQA